MSKTVTTATTWKCDRCGKCVSENPFDGEGLSGWGRGRLGGDTSQWTNSTREFDLCRDCLGLMFGVLRNEITVKP